MEPIPSQPLIPAPRVVGNGAGPSRRLRLSVLVLVAVALVIVAGLGVNWVLTKGHASSTGSKILVGSTYASVSSNLTHWASTYNGGGWSLLGAQGYAIPPSRIPGLVDSSAFIDITGGGSCSYTSLVAANATFDIPATQGNLSSGNASYWRIDMTGSGGSVLTVVELSGTFYPLASGICSSNTTEVVQATTPAVIDSPAVASTAWAAGGAAYASNHTNYTVEYAVSSGIEVFGHYFPPEWSIQYLECSGGVTFSPAPAFVVTVNATSGALEATAWAPTGGCSPTG